MKRPEVQLIFLGGGGVILSLRRLEVKYFQNVMQFFS